MFVYVRLFVICACMPVCVWVLNSYLHECMGVLCVRVCLGVNGFLSSYLHECMGVFVCVCICVCVCVCVCPFD